MNLRRMLMTLKELVARLQKALKTLEPLFTPEMIPSGADDKNILEQYDSTIFGKCVARVEPRAATDDSAFMAGLKDPVSSFSVHQP